MHNKILLLLQLDHDRFSLSVTADLTTQKKEHKDSIFIFAIRDQTFTHGWVCEWCHELGFYCQLRKLQKGAHNDFMIAQGQL